jgi:oligosaccharide repeat unit polymerase
MKVPGAIVFLLVSGLLGAVLIGGIYFQIADPGLECSLLMIVCLGLYVVLIGASIWKMTTLIELDVIFSVLLGLYVIVPALLTTWFPDSPLLSDELKARFMPQTPAENVVVLRCITVALLATIWAFLLTPREFVQPIPLLDQPWGPEALRVGLFVMGLGMAIITIMIIIVGLGTYLSSAYADIYVAEEGLGFLQTGITLFQIGLFVLYLARTKNQTVGWLPWVLFIIFALIELRIGRRRMVMETGIGLVILRHHFVRPFRAVTLSLICAIALGCFIAVGQIRAFMGEGMGRMLDYATTELSVEDSKGIFYELFVINFTTNETALMVQRGFPYRLGETYLEAIEILVPLKMHPNRPLAPCQWFVKEFDPEFAARGGGYAYSHIAEGYLNFGYAGVGMVSFLIGLLVRSMVALRRGCPASQGRLLLYAVVCLTTVILIRGDFSSLLKSYIIITWIPALVIVLWLGSTRSGFIQDWKPATIKPVRQPSIR